MALERIEIEPGRFYREVGTQLWMPSVTTVINHLTGGDYAGIPPIIMKRASARGNMVHRLACDLWAMKAGWLPEDYTLGQPCPPSHTEEQWARLRVNAAAALEQFSERYQIEPLAVERADCSPTFGFAGELDLYCRALWKRHRMTAVVEVKATAEQMLGHEVQVQAYRKLPLYRDATLLLLVYVDLSLADTTVVQVQPNPTHWGGFLGQLSVLKWRLTYDKEVRECLPK